jgi:hypothetical protein
MHTTSDGKQDRPLMMNDHMYLSPQGGEHAQAIMLNMMLASKLACTQQAMASNIGR